MGKPPYYYSTHRTQLDPSFNFPRRLHTLPRGSIVQLKDTYTSKRGIYPRYRYWRYNGALETKDLK